MSVELASPGSLPSAEVESAASPSTRYHSLDALRAVALLLGLVLHAALAYLPGPGIGWAIQDASTNLAFGALVVIIHSFRLEVFFLIAGFFARLMVIRRGIAAFAGNRLLRILVPFIGGWFLVSPGLVFAWVWGASKGDPAAIPAALKQVAPAMLFQLSSFLNFRFLNYFALTHLWFLYYLLLIYLLSLLGRALLKRVCGGRVAWSNRADRAFAAMISSRWSVLVLAVLTWFVLLAMKGWGVDTPDKSFRPNGPALLLYGLAFTVGWLLHRQASLLENVAARWRYHTTWAVSLVLPALILATFQMNEIPVPRKVLIWTANQGVYALLMWSWVLALLGFFIRFLKRESRVWRYLSDSSYWMYIVHLPIMCILQVALARLPLNCWVKFTAVCAITVGCCLISYHYLVRSTPIGFVLNGRRYPFRWAPWAERVTERVTV